MFLTISSASSVNQQHVALAQLRFFNKLFEVSLVQSGLTAQKWMSALISQIINMSVQDRIFSLTHKSNNKNAYLTFDSSHQGCNLVK